jgi:hypothetical protein
MTKNLFNSFGQVTKKIVVKEVMGTKVEITITSCYERHRIFSSIDVLPSNLHELGYHFNLQLIM